MQLAYLEEAKEDIFRNIDDFKAQRRTSLFPWGLGFRGGAVVRKVQGEPFRVESGTKGAPVVVETNPTYYKFFGLIEHRDSVRRGVNGFHHDEAGLRAQGERRVSHSGRALDVLNNIFVYDSLKKMIKNREIGIETGGSSTGS